MPPEIPGTHKRLNKKAVGIIVAGGAVGAVAILYYRKKQAAAATASTATGTGTDSGIDPDTGMPYDQEYSDYGLGGVGTTPSALGYYDPSTGQYLGTGVGVGTVTTVTTNAAWAQAAEAYLVNLGYDPVSVGAAIGKYLLGSQLTADQYQIVTAAIGFEGYPPQSVPPPIQAGGGGGGQTGTGSGGGTTSTTPKVTVPITFGMSATSALAKIEAAGFQAHTNPLRDPKNTYISKGSSPRGGTKAARGSTVVVNVAVVKRGK